METEPPSARQAEEPSQESPATGPTPATPTPAGPADGPARIGAKPPRTRTSAAFIGLVAGAIVLILLLIFILENTQSVRISYFGATGHVPLGVALLLAAVGGALLAGLLGAARIAQVRHHTKRLSRSGK